MEKLLPIINTIFCLIIATSGVLFWILLEKSENLRKNLHLIEYNIVKFSLVTLFSGSLYSALMMETHQIGEVILNFSLSIIFTWAVYFHKKK